MLILFRNLTVTAVILSILLFLFYHKTRKIQTNKYRFAGAVGLSFIAIAVFTLTGISPLSGFHTDIYWDSISYIPFRGMRNMIGVGFSLYLLENLAGNVVMFIPLGFLLPLIWKRKEKWYTVILTGAGISLLIECSQLFLFRGTDVDDLILNTAGTLVGFVIFLILKGTKADLYLMYRKEAEPKNWNAAFFFSIAIPYIVTVLLGFLDRFCLFYR